LTRVSRAIRHLREAEKKTKTLSRMADFVAFSIAGEDPKQKGTFIKRFLKNHEDAIESALEGSPLYEVLKKMMKDWEVGKIWGPGTASALLDGYT
jgi:hypothetical protein